MYGHPFIEREVFEDENRECLLYDKEKEKTLEKIDEEDIGCIFLMTKVIFHYFVMNWIERIDIKRDKSNELSKLDVFKNKSLYKKYQILKSLKIYLANVTRYVEVKYD